MGPARRPYFPARKLRSSRSLATPCHVMGYELALPDADPSEAHSCEATCARRHQPLQRLVMACPRRPGRGLPHRR